jgi:hypothetical protein
MIPPLFPDGKSVDKEDSSIEEEEEDDEKI